MADISFGVYGNGKYEGGNYNILSSFNVGLYKALKQEGLKTEYVYEYFNRGIIPNLSISFNVFGLECWETVLECGASHLMWSVDSPFWQNINTVKKFSEYPNFVFGCVSQIDREPIKEFFPNLPFLYLPHGVDPELWYPDESERAYDIVFMSSLYDYEEELAKLKQDLSPDGYKFFMDFYRYALDNPAKSIWNIYCRFAENMGFDKSNIQSYYSVYKNITYIITHARRVKLLNSINNHNVKVWGSPLWTKYIQGNAEYMGQANLDEATEIIKKSKIVLHLQPTQIMDGLHERVLNATASEAFVISDTNPAIKSSFNDSIGFYDINNLSSINDVVDYYLKNDEERIEKSKAARKLTLENHTWRNRVKEGILGNLICT